MNTSNPTTVAPERVEQGVTQQLILLPLRSWLVMLPATQAAAALLYRGTAPLWMYLASAALFAAPVTAQWLLRSMYRRIPEGFSDATWRSLATTMIVAGCLAQGTAGALFATLPGDQQRMLIVIALCFVVTIVPSRWDGLQFGLATLALLGPIAGVLALGGQPPVPTSLLAILGGALALFKFAAHDARRQTRRLIADKLSVAAEPHEPGSAEEEWESSEEATATQVPDPRHVAQAAEQAKSALLARLSHALRTPMNGVIGTVELLQHEPLSDRQKQLVQTVQLSATALLEVIENVLERALPAANGSPIRSEPVQPPDVGALQVATRETNVRLLPEREQDSDCDTILVVDDSELNVHVLCEQLRTLGVPADTAADGLQGLAKWRVRRYALVIADIQMPCMDGLEMTRQIRAEEARIGTVWRTPIIALTANARRGIDEQATAAGFDGCLTKPLMLRRLSETLDHWAAARAQALAAASAPPNLSPIDRQALLKMVGGNNDVVDSVLRRFATVGAELVDEIAEAVNDGDRVKRLAHKLKGTARSVCAPRLADLAEKLEVSRNAQGIAALEQEWSRVSATLQRLNAASNKNAA